MHRTMSRTIAAALAALVSAAGAAQAQQPPQQITILSGPQGGSWYGMGGGLADLFADAGVRANAEVGGGISNLISVARGMGELAFSMSIVPRMGELGMEPFPEKVTGISALGRLAENKVHIVVSKDSGVTAVTDLAGQAFASQPVGNVTTEAFKAVLAANNLGEDDLEITRGGQGYGASEMKDRRIVGFTATTNPPSPAFADVAQNLDVRFLPLDEATFAAMKAENPGFTRAEIPAGSYRGQDDAVPTAGTDLILVVSQSMSEDEAYWMTKTLAENIDRLRNLHGSLRDLDLDYMASVEGLELHPGARRYYEEAGVL